MFHRTRKLLVASSAIAVLLASGAGRAQTAATTATGPSITAGEQTVPNRYIGNQSLGQSTRPAGLNPYGVNYSDCINDMTLEYNVYLNNFGNNNSDGMQIWATVNGSCPSEVGEDLGVAVPTCWLVNGGFGPTVISQTTKSFAIRVQDLVGPQQSPPNPPVLVHEGPSACTAQPSYAAVTITLYFIPIAPGGTADSNGTSYSVTVNADLVGPPPPTNVNVGAGDMVLIPTWTANSDTDTLGYDIFIDPPPGAAATPSVVTETICPDGSTTVTDSAASASGASVSDATSGSDVSDATNVGDVGDATSVSDVSDESVDDDASSDATMSSGSSSSTGSSSSLVCYTVNVAPTESAGGCATSVLGGAIVQDSGAIVEDGGVASVVLDDASDQVEVDSGVATGTGGIATIPCQYALGGLQNCPSGSPVYNAYTTTITGETQATYNIPGLVNNQNYAVAVAAVDNSGNVGPPSPQTTTTCNYPAPVNDFFAIYRNAGGQAGGGFCALEAVGMPVGSSAALGLFGITAASLVRRRRRKG